MTTYTKTGAQLFQPTGKKGRVRIPVDLDKIATLKNSGVKAADAGEELGLSRGTITKYYLAFDLADEIIARRDALHA